MMSTELKVIRTAEQYKAYLEEVEALMDVDTSRDQEVKDRLDLLCLLIQDYESKHFQLDIPDPIDAIVFRMKQLNLKQADLAPYFGTTSRVSEVLNRKRKLTVEMIRELSIGLGISAEILIASTDSRIENNAGLDWKKLPIKEMEKRGWIDTSSRKDISNVINDFFNSVGLNFSTAAYKRTLHGEAYSPQTKFALNAWLARVVQKSRENKESLKKFDPSLLDKDFLRKVAQLSWLNNGPQLAIKQIQDIGISIVIEPQLKGTRVDGACLKDSDGTPIIALTLRYDRVDNFWFTLLHELAHVMKHLDRQDTFVDDLEHDSVDQMEAEANRLAKEAFIPRGMWKTTEAFIKPSYVTIEKLSKELHIHPAIIAGRLRQEKNDYTLFNDLIGLNQIKHLFQQPELSTMR